VKRYTLVSQLKTRRVCWIVPGDLTVACQDVLTTELVLDVAEDDADYATVQAAIQAAGLAEAWDLAATLVAQYRLKKCCCRCAQVFRGRGVFLARLELGSSDTARVCQPCGDLLREHL
jgi:hypothetical protein